MCHDGGRFFPPRKEEVVAWWEGAKKVTEEDYLLEHVLPEDSESELPNCTILKVIAAKYPQRLPEIYSNVLHQRPYLYSNRIAYAIVDSPVPRQIKIDKLLAGVRHDRLAHKNAALRSLCNLGYENYIALLTEAVEYLPETPQEPYWPQVRFLAEHVADTDSDEAWTTLTITAMRVDTGTKMEFIQAMNCCEVFDKHHDRRVAFLREFLEDTQVRDRASDPHMFGGPCAGFIHGRLVVGDFATLQLAYVLGLDVDEDPEWTAKDWQKLRQRVSIALNTPQ
jgi:hypothetical protein